MFRENQKLTTPGLPQINYFCGRSEKYINQLNPGVKNKSAFTLVELIIVITILAILATIAFISFQGYTKSARDGNRLSTVTNISKGIDIYGIQVGTFPEPDGTILSGSLAGVQLNRLGVIGDNISRLIKLNKTPTDPVGGNNYVYAVSPDNKYYQIGMTLENLESYNGVTKTTYSDNGSFKAKVVGNYKYPLKYNGKLYSLPSLIFTGTGGDLSQTGNAYFIVDKGLNVPYTPDKSTLNNTQSTTQVLQSITGTGGVTLTGITIPSLTSTDFKSLTNTSTTIQNLQQALGITDQTQLGNVIYGSSYNTELSVNATNGGSTPSNSCVTQPSYTNATFTIGTPTSVNQSWVKGASNCGFTCTGGYTGNECEIAPITGWRLLDTNCEINDISVSGNGINQVWAGCNSTLGTGIEFSWNDASSCYSYSASTTTTECSNVNYMASNKKEKAWSVASGNAKTVNNIWGKLYTHTNTSTACPTGWRVPSDQDFKDLEQALGCAVGELNRDDGVWGCTGLGWAANRTSNNLIEKLQLPLAGGRHADGSTFLNRGSHSYLWSSTTGGSGAYGRYLYWDHAGVTRRSWATSFSFSVRCIKN